LSVRINVCIEFRNITCVNIVTVQRGFENERERERERERSITSSYRLDRKWDGGDKMLASLQYGRVERGGEGI
jgi:hypothetical protein